MAVHFVAAECALEYCFYVFQHAYDCSVKVLSKAEEIKVTHAQIISDSNNLNNNYLFPIAEQ